MGSPYSLALRRFAAGIDLNRRAVRVVLVRRFWPGAGVRIEALETVPLGLSGVRAADEADWSIITRALGQALRQASSGDARTAIPGVMALAEVALTCGACVVDGAKARRGKPEAAVRAAAEQACGLAGEPLALDWHAVAGGREIDFVAAPQSEIDVRIEAASSCGIELLAIDGEPPAALRALRYVAGAVADAQGGDGEAAFHALWVGDTGIHGWYVERGRVAARVRFPSPEHASLADALRTLASQGAVRCAWLCGELDLLRLGGLSQDAMSDLLGCPLEIFSLGMLAHCKGVAPARTAPDYAVAFGLALRGVFE